MAPIPSNNFKNLPHTLRRLEVGQKPMYHGYNPFDDYESELSRWEASDVAQLASLFRLVSFTIDLRFVDTGASLAPLAKVETLKFLALLSCSESHMLQSPSWLPQCLPKDLKNLKIHYSAGETSWQHQEAVKREKQFNDNFLSLCNLAVAVPNLKELVVISHSSNEICSVLPLHHCRENSRN